MRNVEILYISVHTLFNPFHMPFDLRSVPCKTFDLRSFPCKKLSFEIEEVDNKASSASYRLRSEKRITFFRRKWYDHSTLCDDQAILLPPRPPLVYRKLKRHEYSQEDDLLDNHKKLFKKSSKEESFNTKSFVEKKTPSPSQVLSGGRISVFRSRTTPDFDNDY